MTTATKEKQEVTVTRYHESNNEDMTRLCKEFSAESLDAYGLGVTPRRLSEMIKVCKDAMFFLRIDGKVVGVICGTVVANTCNDRPALQEVMWYVEKAHRSHGKILLKYFEEAAKNMGCVQIVMGLMCNSMADRIGRLYERMGYKKFEIQYMKEI